jgi:hypothetical protein
VARDATTGLAPASEQRLVLARLSSQSLGLLAKVEAQYQRLTQPSASPPLIDGPRDTALAIAALCDIASTLSRNLETWALAAQPGRGELGEEEGEAEAEAEEGQALARALGAFESAGVDGRRRRDRRIAAQ